MRISILASQYKLLKQEKKKEYEEYLVLLGKFFNLPRMVKLYFPLKLFVYTHGILKIDSAHWHLTNRFSYTDYNWNILI